MSDPDETQIETAVAQDIPAVLPVLPLRDTVVFPDTMIPLTIGQERSIKLIDDVLAGDRLLAMVTSRDAEIETPGPDLLYPVGTVGLAHKMIKLPDGTMRILVQGLQRVRVKEYVSEEPYLVARTEKIEDVATESKRVGGAARQPAQRVQQDRGAGAVPAGRARDGRGQRRGAGAAHVPHRQHHAHQGRGQAGAARGGRRRAAHAQAHRHPHARARRPGAGLQDPERRARRDRQEPARVLPAPAAQGHPAGARRDRRARGRDQRAAPEGRGAGAPGGGRQGGPPGARPPQQHLAAERRVPGHPHVPGLDHHAALERAAARTTSTWRTPARSSTATTTTSRRSRTASSSSWPCASSRTTCTGRSCASSARPAWARRASATASPRPWAASSSASASAACATRPRSAGIAAPTSGAMPGIIVRAMRDAGTNNPLFMIDEIDKMGADWRGDPSSAMLEVLDPEQNVSFRDHYMDLPFDLSRVLFITTANQLEPIPGPLRDRMEIINLAGYTIEEKLHIARKYLVPRQIEANGLKPGQVTFKDEAIVEIITSYTREAGVRNVEREIGTICRKLAREVAEASQRQPQALHRQRQARARPARAAAPLQRRQAAHQRPRRGHRPRLDAGRRRHPLHRGHGDARQRPPHGDRPARRRHEGVGHGGHELRAHALAGARPRGRLLPDARHPHPRAGRRDPQGRPQRRRDHGQRDLLAGHRHAGQQRRRHDRRGHADRPGAAHRRAQGEDPRRAARRHHHGDPAEPQRGRPRGRARGAAQGHDVHPGGPGRAGLGGRHGSQAGRARGPAHRGRRPHRGGRRAAREGAAQGRQPGGRRVQRPGGRRGPARSAAKPAAKAAAKKPAARKPAPGAGARPKATPAKPKGAAKKTTAARGRSGRKK